MKQTLSVIVITHNEAPNIERCLTSVAFADEIVIVDSESTDNTVELAKAHTPHVYVQAWQGFGAQKQTALNHATQDWVLSLDADEVVSAELRQEILNALCNAPSLKVSGYAIPFISYFCGHPIRYGDWRNERHLRLFQRSQGQFSADDVHEKIKLNGPIKRLSAPIHHHSYPNLSTVLQKIERYSSIGAHQKFKAGKRASFASALAHGVWAFLRGYVLKLGFLDGIPGFLLAFSKMEETFYRYLKLRERYLLATPKK